MAAATMSYNDGNIHLQFDSPSLAGQARTALTGGGTLAVEPTDPTRLLAVDLESDDLDDLAGVMTVLVDHVDAESDTSVVESVEPGPRLEALERLAFASWYSLWNPLSLERSLVRLDVAAAAWEAGQKVRAYDIFDEHADALEQLLITEATSGPVHDEVTTPLCALAALAVTALGDDDQRCGRLVDAAANLTRSTSGSVEMLSEPLLAAAGVRELLLLQSDVDWTRVPPRTLATDDGTVLLEGVDGMAEITVAAHPCLAQNSPAIGHLLARLIDRTTGEPVMAAPLEHRAGDGSQADVFHAQIPYGDADPQNLTVDIVDARMLTAVREGADAASARLERAAVRALVWTRLREIAARLTPQWGTSIPSDDYLSRLRAGLERSGPLRERPDVQRTASWLATVTEDPGRALTTAPLTAELVWISRHVRQSASRTV